MYNVYPSTSGGPNVSGFPQCPYNFPYSYPCVLNVPNGTLDPVIMAIKSACTTEIN